MTEDKFKGFLVGMVTGVALSLILVMTEHIENDFTEVFVTVMAGMVTFIVSVFILTWGDKQD